MNMPRGAKTERAIDALRKPAKKRAVDESTDLPDAWDLIEKLQKEIAKLKKRVEVVEKQSGETYSDLMERERRGETLKRRRKCQRTSLK